MNWFKRKGLFFMPASFMGLLIYSVMLIYAVVQFFIIDSHSHSASDTLRPFIINCGLLFIVYSVIGYFTHQKNR